MDDNEISTLTIVSYNISFAEPSFAAPDRTRRSQESPNLIRDEILKNQTPDIIALQESPSESWASSIFGPEYISLGTTVAAHVQNGYIDLLVKQELLLANNTNRRITLYHPALPLPSVAALLTLANGTTIAVCSIHLPHTAEGATSRELMCEAIMQIISQHNGTTTTNCILIGDFNMRNKEDTTIENLVGGNWIDVWKQNTTGNNEDATKKFTWNSRINKFHRDGYAFTCRFDRCYVRGSELIARSFDLIGNTPVSGAAGDAGDYLSDHFGIVVKIGVKSSPTTVSALDASNNRVKKDVNNMVDLTGDSDNDEKDTMDSKDKHINNNKININQSSYYTVESSSGSDTKANRSSQISADDLRRLRLERLGQKSTVSSMMGIYTNNCKSDCVAGDIEPVNPSKFTVSKSNAASNRYIIYMAIREKKGSAFESALARCRDVCHDGVQHCLQMDGTRHITMFDGLLTSDQLQSLSLSGQFDDGIDIRLTGWKPWDAGCYLNVEKESECSLKELLTRINGLPTSGGKRPCDHLSLYRKRATTNYHINHKREFANIREATRMVDFGSVQGISIRIKAFGGPYDECRVLAESTHGRQADAKVSEQPSNEVIQKEEWNDGCDSDDEIDRKPKANEQDLVHEKLHHDKQNQSDYDDVMESEDTPLRVNGSKIRSAKTAKAKSTNNIRIEYLRDGSKKEQEKKVAAAKKRCRFDSSSSDDEGFEDMKRRLLEKQGKKYKKRRLPHLPNSSSSDEDV